MLLLANAENPPRSDNGRKQGYMKIMKDLWEEKGYKDLGFTSQHLRDQAAKLERSLGNVRDLITTCVGKVGKVSGQCKRFDYYLCRQSWKGLWAM